MLRSVYPTKLKAAVLLAINMKVKLHRKKEDKNMCNNTG